jgi:hypothetical protein
MSRYPTKYCKEYGEIQSNGKCVLPVIFRTWKSGQFKGHVDALFPTMMADSGNRYITSYAHVGQHGQADYYFMVSQTRSSKPEEYKPLLKELRTLVGYKRLKIYKKANPDWRAEAIERLKEI